MPEPASTQGITHDATLRLIRPAARPTGIHMPGGMRFFKDLHGLEVDCSDIKGLLQDSASICSLRLAKES